jgi:serine/threonine protein kinase
MAQVKLLGPFGGPNEHMACDYMAAHLPDDWHILANRQLDTAKREEVDFFILAQNNLFIIEEKSWGPKVLYGDLNWIVIDDKGIERDRKSAFIDLSIKAKITAGWLKTKIAGFENVRGHKVIDYVLLSHPRIEAMPKIGAFDTGRVVTLLEICKTLMDFDSKNNDNIFKDHRDSILKLLCDYKHRNVDLPRIKDYKIHRKLELDNTPNSPGIMKFEAEHQETGNEFHLKCYIKNNWAIDSNLANQRHRDFKASEVLQSTQRAWVQSEPFSDDENDLWIYPYKKPEGAISLDQLGSPENAASFEVYNANKWGVISDAFQALEQLNEKGIVHRTLAPNRVWISRGSRIVFNDFMVAHLEGEMTISEGSGDVYARDFLAPECVNNIYLATHLSDVFALAKILCAFFKLNFADSSDPYAQVLADCLNELPEERISAAIACGRLSEILNPVEPSVPVESVDALLDAPVELSDVDSDDFGGRFGPHFKNMGKLGSGASGISWLAQRVTEEGLELVVIKEARSKEIFKNLQEEYVKSYPLLPHSRCAKAQAVVQDPSPGFLVNNYVPGLTLKRFLNPDDVSFDSVRTSFLSALDILEMLHKQKFIHGDVSPNNIVIEPESSLAGLIDFGELRKFERYEKPFGTRKVYAPEAALMQEVGPATDVYSLSASYLNLILGRSHRKNPDGDSFPDFEVVPLSQQEALQFSENYQFFLNLLFLAVQPDIAKRLPLEELRNRCLDTYKPRNVELDSELHPMVNENVSHLRSLYTASKNAAPGAYVELALLNESTKKFYQDTYIDTSLELELLPSILRHERKVVLFTGNPGGGKTSFLNSIQEALLADGGEYIGETSSLESLPVWIIKHKGIDFHAILDASQSHQDKSANDLVKTALNDVRDKNSIALIAINDGRLKQFFIDFSDEYPSLEAEVNRYFKHQIGDNPDFLIIDLKARAMVSLNKQGLFSESITKLTSQKLWSTCSSCSLQNVCPIFINQRQIQTQKVVGRLSELTLYSYLKRNERPNFRRIRSAISYLISGDLSCKDVHEGIEQKRDFMPNSLANLAFAGGSGDSLVDSWKDFDPSKRISPSLRAVIPVESVNEITEDIYADYARKVFIGQFVDHDLTGESDRELSPYKFSDLYIDYLQTRNFDIKPILHGLSRLSSAHLPYRDGLCVVDADSKSGWSVIKVVPEREFELSIHQESSKFFETAPEFLQLTHKSTNLHFRFTIDSFDLILRSAAGEIFNDHLTSSIRFDLANFATMLLRSPVHKVLLMDPSGTFHNVQADGPVIELLGESSA